MSLSGIDKQVAQTPEVILASLQHARGTQLSQLPDSMFEKLLDAMDLAFDPEAIRTEIQDEITEGVSEAQATEVLEWFRSEAGIRVTRAEVDASTAEAYGEMMALAEDLLQRQELVEVARQVDELANATEFAMKLQETVAIAVLHAGGTAERDLEAKTDELKELLRAPEIRTALERQVQLGLAYSYRDLPSELMNSYLDFLREPASMAFHSAVWNGFDAAFSEGMQNAMKAFVLEVREQVGAGD
jgi:hypothetical protein